MKLLDGVFDIAAVVQRGLEEPLVELDAVALEVALHLRDVALQTKARHVSMTLLDGLV